jgi:uncharacterized protein
MPVHEGTWSNGTPSWVDLMVDDVPAARGFYSSLFGWETPEGPPETGGYVVATLQDQPVAGISPKPPGAEFPNVWSTYLATDDVDATVARAKEAGGTFVTEPMDVLESGRMAFGVDPTGAHYGLWQGNQHQGVGLVNEPGALTWNEVMTRDYEGAQEFYATVFGYTYEEIGEGDFRYATITNGDAGTIGGVGRMGVEMPAEIPAHWATYFAVDDADAAVSRIQELGGRALVAPFDTPYGRMAVVQGSQGEQFSVIKPTQAAGGYEG